MCCQFQLLGCWTAILVACAMGFVAPAAVVCSDEVSRIERSKLDEDFRVKLEALSARCQQLGLEPQAQATGQWFIERDPRRQYLFLPSSSDAHQPPAESEQLIRKWYAKFVEHRQAQSAGLFQLARQALEAQEATLAYQLVHEVLREDPDHEEARRILGYRQVNGQWRRPGSNPTSRTMRHLHPHFGWRPGHHWRVQSEHFEISTGHSPEDAIELARRLEQLYDIWKQIFFRHWSNQAVLAGWFDRGAPVSRSRENHRVVLFRDREEYLSALGKHASRSVAQRASLTRGIYLNEQNEAWFYWGGDDQGTTWLHEATHQLFQETAVDAVRKVGSKDNFWIVEGAALYLESLTPHGSYVTVGGFDALQLQRARFQANHQQFFIPLEELAKLSAGAIQDDEKRIRNLYWQSAGLAHFLMDFESGRYRKAAIDYLRLVYAGRQRPDTLVQLTGVGFEELDRQYRDFLQVRDEDLIKYLNPPERITMLALGRTEVSDEGLKALAACVTLESLDLSLTDTTDVGLAHLTNLKNLTELGLAGTQITDAGLVHLRGLKKLDSLDVRQTKVSTEALHELKRWLPNLEN